MHVLARHILLLTIATSGLAGCGAGDGGYGGGDLGVTTGGVKDLNLARSLIDAGMVPPADALLVEAMFAEHDLPLDGPPCATRVCIRGAAGVAPDIDGAPRGWLQLGLSSSLAADEFIRPPTTYIYTVDVSGSMGWSSAVPTDDGGYVTPGQLSRVLLHQLTEQLRPDDQVAIVTYGDDVATALAPIAGSARGAIHAAIDRLSTNGSTNMEAGVRRALALGDSLVAAGRDTRMVLFTDEQPNVGATSESEFAALVRGGAERGVDTTVFAFGLGIGAELLRGMASWPGANAFSLTSLADVTDFMTHDAPYYATPVAYDLRVTVGPLAPWSLQRALGLPSADDGEVGLRVATLFLSTRRGAILLALDPGSAALASLSTRLDLVYEDDAGTHSTTLPINLAAAPSPMPASWFAQPAVARTTALALLTEGMHAAARAYATDPEQAVAILEATEARFAADQAALAAPDFEVELQLVRAMLALVRDGAPQGSLYDV